MRISDWSSDVCSSDLAIAARIGRDIAANGCRAPRAEIKREQRSLRIDRLAHRLQHAPRLHGRRATRNVNLFNLVHALKRERYMPIRFAAFDKARLAATRHNALTRRVAELQRCGNLFGQSRAKHGTRADRTSTRLNSSH